MSANEALRPTVTLYVPDGYKDAAEFLSDCQFESVDKTRAWDAIAEKNAELAQLRDFVNWVDSWVSNPVGSYSVYALDGLFGMTRDKIAALRKIS